MEITEEIINIQMKSFEKKIEDFKGYLSMISYSDEAKYIVEKMGYYEVILSFLKFQKGLLNDEKNAIEKLNNMDKYATGED